MSHLHTKTSFHAVAKSLRKGRTTERPHQQQSPILRALAQGSTMLATVLCICSYAPPANTASNYRYGTILSAFGTSIRLNSWDMIRISALRLTLYVGQRYQAGEGRTSGPCGEHCAAVRHSGKSPRSVECTHRHPFVTRSAKAARACKRHRYRR